MGISLGDLKDFGKPLIKGLIAEAAPDILAGALVELLRERKVDVKKASEWVESNSRLWDSLDEMRRNAMKRLCENVTDLSWITGEWVINAIKGEFPAVASLFLGWKKASNWLDRQVEIIREEVQK